MYNKKRETIMNLKIFNQQNLFDAIIDFFKQLNINGNF